MMIIEAATIEDAAAILALQKRAYQSEAELYQDPTISPLVETLAEIEAAFADHLFLKAVIDDQIVGSVRVRKQGATWLIGRLCVEPTFENRGIGTQLMCAVEARGAAPRLELFTGHKSERNLHLYHKLGFQEFRREWINPSLTFVFLEKHLPPNQY
jgi:ribosomal protein S18 acetylase RimI-like enzyme